MSGRTSGDPVTEAPDSDDVTLCDGVWTTDTDPGLVGGGVGVSAIYSFVDVAGKPAFDVRLTVVETDVAVQLGNSRGHAVVRQESAPGRTRLQWDFMSAETGRPVTLEPVIGIADLDRQGLETLIVPRRMISGTVAAIGNEPLIQEGPDAVYYLSNPDMETTTFSVELAEADGIETIIAGTEEAGTDLWFSFGCRDSSAAMLAMTASNEFSEGEAGRSPTMVWIGLGILTLAVTAAGTYVAKARRDARNSLIDPLTGCYNAAAVDRRLRPVFEDPEQAGYAVLRIDIDHFREVNTSRGTAAGDAVLKAIAERAARHVRAPSDAVVRIGGGEFLIALLGLTDPVADAESVAALIMGEAEEPIVYGETSIVVSISIGVAYCEKPCDVRALAGDADQVLYVAKDHGEAQLRVHPAPTSSLEQAPSPDWQELPSLLSYRRD